MNKLKYINGKIDFHKEKLADIKNCKKVCVREDQLKELSKEETFYTERLQMLKQIKNDLEAWEVVKEKITIRRGEFIPHILDVQKGKGALTHQEYRPLKLALELEKKQEK